MSFYLAGTQLAALNLARIGYRSVIRGASLTASSTASGYSVDSVANVQTWDAWRAGGSSGSITASFSSTAIEYVAIGGHNFGEMSGSVSITLQVGGSTVFSGIVNKYSSGIYFECDGSNATSIEVSVNAVGGTPQIGCLFAGEALIMDRPIYGGHSPIDLSRETTRSVNLSEAGELLGTSVKRRALQTSYQWDHLKADWYSDNFDDFADYISNGPGGFFIAWRPGDSPDSVAYGWSASGDIQPSNMGVRDYMQVSLTMRGHLPLARVQSWQ